MEVKAAHRYARISPLKARDLAREVTGLPVSNALDIIRFTPKKAAVLIGKTLKSAIANAENNFDLSVEDLVVKSATVTDGPSFKRWNPRARGGAAPIRKRTAHINIILSDELAEGREAAEAAARARTAPKKKTATKKAPTAKKEATAKKADSGESKPAAKATGGAKKAAGAAKPAAPEGAVMDSELGYIFETKPEQVDDLTKISGVGPKLAEKLHDAGIYTYEQIALWSDENKAVFAERLSFADRIERDDWVGQATELAANKGH